MPPFCSIAAFQCPTRSQRASLSSALSSRNEGAPFVDPLLGLSCSSAWPPPPRSPLIPTPMISMTSFLRQTRRTNPSDLGIGSGRAWCAVASRNQVGLAAALSIRGLVGHGRNLGHDGGSEAQHRSVLRLGLCSCRGCRGEPWSCCLFGLGDSILMLPRVLFFKCFG